MVNKKHIAFVLGLSVLLVVLLALWVELRNGELEPSEVLLEDETELDEGPLTAEELEVTKPSITNDMNHIAVFSTNKGIIRIELFEDVMPITAGNFIQLAEEGFYDSTKFHRVIDSFMIQGGDPNSKEDDTSRYGLGGPGHSIQDEFVSSEYLTNTRGTIAMANSGQPNSGGSQFFINTVNNTNLDFDKEPRTSKHPVFGRVIEGMDVVDAISKVETGPDDIPTEPVVVESVVIEEGGG